MNNDSVKIDLLFETSWEVCNKIGGIYTVLSTKAKTLQKLYKDKVIFIGPDVWSDTTPSPYFVESPSILKLWRENAIFPEGISVRVGRWDIPGKPIAILVKFDSMYAVNNELFGKMWELYGVESINSYGDYGEACAFSHAAAIVIESICDFKGIAGKHIIAHFDEWTTGMGLLYIKWKLPQIATIFTTHATSIGRSICGNNKPLYDYLKGYNGDQMAGELNMEAKHSLEKKAAHAADCFTTVSDITAIECEQLLDLKPAVVTPNGFEQNFVPAKSKFAQARVAARTSILKVATALTGKDFGTDTFIIATSGRCEYRNKGLDLFLDSINNLRHRNTHKEILALILVPAWVNSPRSDLREAIDGEKSDRLRDPVITHNLNESWADPILSRIHSLGFTNSSDENVSVIYVPCYLNGNDGIFNMPYYDMLIGMDATVFPSYYEPWGYTPLESIAFGVPTVTTSLSGFGQWVLKSFESMFEKSGVTVIPRTDSNYGQVSETIASTVMSLVNATHEQRSEMSAAARITADMAAWENFITYYIKAFDIALAKANERVKLY